MKSLLKITVVYLISVGSAYPQDARIDNDSILYQETLSSIDLGILGGLYAFEWRFRDRMSLRGSLGIVGRVFSRAGLFAFADAAEYFAAFRPSIGISSRFYLSQRNDKGMSIYLDPKLHYMPDWFLKWVEQNDNAWGFQDDLHTLEFNPQFGLSLGSKNNIYFDFRIGYIFPLRGVFKSEWNSAYEVPVSTFARIGYRF